MDDVCTQIKLRLAQMVSEDNFKTWIEPVKFLNYKEWSLLGCRAQRFFPGLDH